MCAFCRVRAARNNREHLLPDWLADVFPSDAPQPHWRTVATPSGHHEKLYRQKPFRAKLGCTCSPCNNGWMSDVENESKSLLTALARSPLSFTLTHDDQERLTRWAYLRLLVAQFAQGADVPNGVPSEHYAYFFEHRSPPSGVQVWIGRRAREGAWPYRFLGLAGELSARREPSPPLGRDVRFNLYQAVLMLGHLVVFYSGRLDGGGPIVHESGVRETLREVWPTGPRIIWPPENPVDSARIAAHFDSRGRYVEWTPTR